MEKISNQLKNINILSVIFFINFQKFQEAPFEFQVISCGVATPRLKLH